MLNSTEALREALIVVSEDLEFAMVRGRDQRATAVEQRFED